MKLIQLLVRFSLILTASFLSQTAWGQACYQPLAFEKVSLQYANLQTQSGSFTVQDNNSCGWRLENIPPWVHVTNLSDASGSGTRSVRFTIDPPSQSGARAGYIRAGNYYVVVHQQAAPSTRCSPRSLTGNNVSSFPGFVEKLELAGGTAQFRLGPDSFNCGWGFDQGVPWIQFPSKLDSGTFGTGAVGTIHAGATTVARVGVLIIANQPLLVYQGSVPQPPAACQYHVGGPSDQTLSGDPIQIFETFQVTTNPQTCLWTATKPADAYGEAVNGSGIGNGSVRFRKYQNFSTKTFVSSLQFSFNFAVPLITPGVSCAAANIQLYAPPAPIPAAGGQVHISFRVPDGCPLNIGFPNWLTQLSLRTAPVPGDLALVAGPNTHQGVVLSGAVSIAGQQVTIQQQAPAPCSTTTVAPGTLTIPAGGGGGAVTINAPPGCQVAVTGGGDGFTAATNGAALTISRAANDSTSTHSATFYVFGKPVVASQPGASCANVTLTSPRTIANTGGSAPVQVTLPHGCAWTATPSGAWFHVSPAAGNGPGSFLVVANGVNPGSLVLNGSVSVLGSSVAVHQARTPIKGGVDFDGDGRQDPIVFRPSSGVWYLLPSSAHCPASFDFASTPADGLPGCQRQFGLGTDIAFTADFDGDNRKDLALWRASNRTIYVAPSSGACPPNDWSTLRNIDGKLMCSRSVNVTGAVPIAADFDNDGYSDAALFRSSDQMWIVASSSGVAPAGFNVILGPGLYGRQFGLTGDKPASADYDNDGATDLAVYRVGVTYMAPSSGVCPAQWTIEPGQTVICSWKAGLPDDLLLPADYDGDGKADLGFFRLASQFWLIFAEAAPGLQGLTPTPDGHVYGSRQWGLPGDIPVVSDFDGDGKVDITVFRPAEGRWYLFPSTGICPARIPRAGVTPDDRPVCNLQWGLNGDVPLP